MNFSITIPAYKARFLNESIESVLAQTYKDFELIIVNDASPEDLTSIVKSFEDPRISYYINEKNCGAINVVDNWNKCLSYAKGDYIICMGDDDKLLPNCLDEYVKLIKKYPGLGLYHAWTEIIDEESRVVGLQEPRPEKEGVYSLMWGRWNGRIQFIGDYLFDRKLLMEHGGFYKMPLAWATDDISIYIAAKANGVANMQVPGFQYRINTQTISRTGNAMVKLDAIRQEEDWYKSFLSDEPSKENEIEFIYWKMLTGKSFPAFRTPNVISNERIRAIYMGLENMGIFQAWRFMRERKMYRLQLSEIGYAVLKRLVKRFYAN